MRSELQFILLGLSKKRAFLPPLSGALPFTAF
jgi:hypothetical protein